MDAVKKVLDSPERHLVKCDGYIPRNVLEAVIRDDGKGAFMPAFVVVSRPVRTKAVKVYGAVCLRGCELLEPICYSPVLVTQMQPVVFNIALNAADIKITSKTSQTVPQV